MRNKISALSPNKTVQRREMAVNGPASYRDLPWRRDGVVASTRTESETPSLASELDQALQPPI